MDSITQITLGAAVGEAVLGKKAGNKAILWGAVAGTIPDLDVIFGAFMDPVQRLVFHRGFSHSILFAVLFAPLLGYIISKIHRKESVGWKDWTLLSFWSIFTHPLLDSFTTYGTQLFYPFSNYPVAFNTIFVIDPFYTVPFLMCIIAVMFFKRASRKRRIINWVGIALSSAYLALTVANKLYVDSVVTASLERQAIAYDKFMTTPAPLNNILWRVVAVGGNRAYQGYYSLLDTREEVAFKSVDRNLQLLEPLKNYWEIKELVRVSKDFYTLFPEEDAVVFNDMRFGQFTFDSAEDGNYIFSFKIRRNSTQPGNELEIMRVRPNIYVDGELIRMLMDRIRGN